MPTSCSHSSPQQLHDTPRPHLSTATCSLSPEFTKEKAEAVAKAWKDNWPPLQGQSMVVPQGVTPAPSSPSDKCYNTNVGSFDLKGCINVNTLCFTVYAGVNLPPLFGHASVGHCINIPPGQRCMGGWGALASLCLWVDGRSLKCEATFSGKAWEVTIITV